MARRPSRQPHDDAGDVGGDVAVAADPRPRADGGAGVRRPARARRPRRAHRRRDELPGRRAAAAQSTARSSPGSTPCGRPARSSAASSPAAPRRPASRCTCNSSSPACCWPRSRSSRRASCCPTAGASPIDRRRRTAGRRWRPRRVLVVLFLVGVAIALAELPPNDWSALLLSDRFDVSTGQAGLGFVAVAGGMLVGRVVGDRVTDAWGLERTRRARRRAGRGRRASWRPRCPTRSAPGSACSSPGSGCRRCSRSCSGRPATSPTARTAGWRRSRPAPGSASCSPRR